MNDLSARRADTESYHAPINLIRMPGASLRTLCPWYSGNSRENIFRHFFIDLWFCRQDRLIWRDTRHLHSCSWLWFIHQLRMNSRAIWLFISFLAMRSWVIYSIFLSLSILSLPLHRHWEPLLRSIIMAIVTVPHFTHIFRNLLLSLFRKILTFWWFS
mgnify:CR=1|jgi:hypothetical protein